MFRKKEKLAGSPEEIYYIRILNKKIPKDKFVLLISSILGLILLFFSIIYKLYTDYYVFSTVILSVFSIIFLPYTVYKALENREIRKIEEKYPFFLRDLADALMSGMDMLQALQHVSKIDYGPLTKYVRKLYIWLTWGESFENAFKKFNKYFLKSPRILQANDIIMETYLSGGNIDKVLKRIASDFESIENLVKLRSSYVSQQVLVLYVIFLIYIGLVIILKIVLTPMISQQFTGGGEEFGLGFTPGFDMRHYKTISALAILVNSFFIAFIIGAAEGKRLSQSFKHLAITMLIAMISILVFLLPPSIEMELNVDPNPAYLGKPITISGYITIDASPATGNVLLNIYGPSTEVKNLPLKDGSFSFEYIPSSRGRYAVRIAYTYNQKVYSKSIDVEVI